MVQYDKTDLRTLMRALLNDLNFSEILAALKREKGESADRIDWARQTKLVRSSDESYS